MTPLNYLCPIVLLVSSLAYSATYYVSFTSGSDSSTAVQAQNQATPWKSLAKVSAQAFAAGDNILFKRGDSWEGTLTASSSGASGSPVTYGAYGTGGSPKIKGTVTIASPWTRGSGNIYQTDVSQNINQLFLNGRPLTLARYPNAGYLAIGDTLGSATLTCALLNAVDWTSATVHVRTAHWTIASKRVVSCNTAQKSLTLEAAPVYGLKPGWGFFINNKLEALDTAGEWYYDSIGHKLYVWTPNGDSPANYTVEGSVYQTGFSISGKSYVTVGGFSIVGHTSYGILGTNATNLVIDGNTISYADAVGIYLNGSGQNNTITDDTIEGCNRSGVETYGASLTFSGNVVRNIALIRNFTRYGMGDLCCSGLGLEENGDNAQIRNNVLDSIGYIGMRPSGVNNLIENNFVQHCCLSKDDGGGIYTGWQSDSTQTGSAGTIIRRNIVLSSQSAPAGTPDVGYTPGEGIYIDDYGHDVSIIQNTTANCANHGIFLHHNRNITVSGNVSYNNKVQFGFDESSSDAAGYVRGNVARSNVFYSLSENQVCFENSPVHTALLVSTDSNYYCNPYSDVIITLSGTGYGLSGWQSAKGQDAHSKVSLVSFSPYQITDTLGANLVVNGTFTSNISQWSSWPAPVQISWAAAAGLDGGCMKVLYNDDTQAQSCLVYPASFALTQGQAYLLRFSAIANKAGSLQAIVRMAHAPWSVVGTSRAFILGSARKDFAAIFFADTTDPQCRVDFSNTKADSLYWLDNVSIVPVSVVAADPAEKSKLFYNASLQSQVVSLGGKRYQDLDGNAVQGSITLNPFMSRILIADTGMAAVAHPSGGRNGMPAISVTRRAGGRSLGIAVTMDRQDKLTVSMYDFAGRRIALLFDGIAQKGTRSFDLNGTAGRGTRISCGNYVVRVEIGNRVYIEKLVDVQL